MEVVDVDDSSSMASSTDSILNMRPFSQRSSSTGPERSGGKDDTDEEDVQVVGSKYCQATATISNARRSEAVTVIITKPSKTCLIGVTLRQEAGTTGEILIRSINPGSLFVGTDMRAGMELVSIDGEKCVTIPQTSALLKTKEGQLTIVAKAATTTRTKTTTATTTTTTKVGMRRTTTATKKAAASIATKKVPTTTKSLSSVRTTSMGCDDDNDDEKDSDDDPFADLSPFAGSKKRRKLAYSCDDDDDDDDDLDGSDVTSGGYTSTSEYSKNAKYEGKRNNPMVMTNPNKSGHDEDDTVSINCKGVGRFMPGQHVWVNLGSKESHAAVIHSIVDATEVIVKWPIACTYEKFPIVVLELMFDHSINGAEVPSKYSKRSRKKTDMYAPIIDDRTKLTEEQVVVEEEYLSDEGETGTAMKGFSVNASSTKKSSQELKEWNEESTEPTTKRHETLEGSEQQEKKGRGGKRNLGRGWTKGLLPGSKSVCWMSPDAKIKFSSWEAARKFEELRKQFDYNESLAWNEHLRVSAGVADPRFQFSAVHSDTQVTNKASAKISHGTLSSDTNGDSTDHSDKNERSVDHLIGATIYVSDGKFRGKSGTLEERGFGGWCTISGIPKRIKINSCSIVNDGKIDLKAARAMQRFMPPVMTPSQMAKAPASTDNSAITPIEPPNDFHEGQHVLVMDGKTEYQAVIVSIDSPKKYKRRMATVRWSTWKGRTDEVKVTNIRPMFSFESFLDPPGQSTIKRNRIQTDRLSIVPGSNTYVGTTIDSERCNSLVSKRKSHEDPPGQSTVKRKRIQTDRLSVVSGSKSYFGTTIDSKQCNRPVSKRKSHERVDKMNICNVKNARKIYTSSDGAGWKKRRYKDQCFFDQVGKLKAFKMKHGHLNISSVRDKHMYNFCHYFRTARREIISGQESDKILTQERIAALDAIGFDWKLSPATSSSAVRNTCQPPEEFRRKRGRPTKARKESQYRDFFDRVDDLKSFKMKHGHLNINHTKNKSMYKFCYNVRNARRDIMSGKGSIMLLTKDRIAALDAIGFDWNLSPSSGQPRKRGRPSSGTTTTKTRKKMKNNLRKCKEEEVELDGVNENEYNSLWNYYMEQSVRENEELLGCGIQLRRKVVCCNLLRSNNDVFRKEVHKKIMILKAGGRKIDILRILKLMKEYDSGELPKPDLYKLMDEILGQQTAIDDELEILDLLESSDDQHMISIAGDGQHPGYNFELDDSDSVGRVIRPNIDCKLAGTNYAEEMAEDLAERLLGSKKVINPCHQYQQMETINLTEDDDLDLNTSHEKPGKEKCTRKHTSSATNASVDDRTNGQSQSANIRHSNFVDLSQNEDTDEVPFELVTICN